MGEFKALDSDLVRVGGKTYTRTRAIALGLVGKDGEAVVAPAPAEPEAGFEANSDEDLAAQAAADAGATFDPKAEAASAELVVEALIDDEAQAALDDVEAEISTITEEITVTTADIASIEVELPTVDAVGSTPSYDEGGEG